MYSWACLHKMHPYHRVHTSVCLILQYFPFFIIYDRNCFKQRIRLCFRNILLSNLHPETPFFIFLATQENKYMFISEPPNPNRVREPEAFCTCPTLWYHAHYLDPILYSPYKKGLFNLKLNRRERPEYFFSPLTHDISLLKLPPPDIQIKIMFNRKLSG